MTRLSPDALPLWRADGRVQFGDPALAVSPFAAPWVDVVVGALVVGTTPRAVRGLARVHGAPEGAADELLAAIAPALRQRRRRLALAVQSADDLPPRAARAVLAALPARTPVVPWAGADTDRVAAGTAVIVLAAHRVDPRRTAMLVRDDIAHLPLVFDGRRARIGPVVHPGRTACLTCLDAERRRADPHWPVIAAQLLGRRLADVDVALAAEAGRAARFLLEAPVTPTTRSLSVSGDSFPRVWELHRPSADCHCRSPGGSATATAPSVPDRAPSSPTAFARPA